MKTIGSASGRACAAVLCAALAALAVAAPAQAAPEDPTFVFVPSPPPPPFPIVPPPTGYLDGPCGVVVDSADRFYVADHYHDVVDVFTSLRTYVTQLSAPDPLDGPCGLALDDAGNLYVNDYHRAVRRFNSLPSFGTGAVLSGAPLDSSHPTGVAVDPATGYVYVDDRTYIAAYTSAGPPVLDGEGHPLKIGLGTLGDGYGLAVSGYAGTLGRIYVPDAADDTVKVYDPLVSSVDPVMTIDGSSTPAGEFVSLRDSAAAVDDASGDVYVADNLQPAHTEEPQATIHVYSAAGSYEGHLKYNIADALPPGLAVDNKGLGQGRVYVTSGNTDRAGIYAYPPGAATTSTALPPSVPLALRAHGSGSISSATGGIECASSCEDRLRSGERVELTATPDPGSAFAGWSGGGCAGTDACSVTMSEARSVSAEFAPLAGPLLPTGGVGGGRGGTAGTSAEPVAGASEIVQKGTLRVAVSGKLRPGRLPRKGTAPIAASVGGEISTTDASLPPQLKKLRIELNRHSRLDYAGLPICSYRRIQPGSSSHALAACRSALVGKGSFSADITLAGQEPYPTQGRLLVFNGRRHGEPVLYGHIYAPRPFATSFVIVFAVGRLRHGTYGTVLDAALPKEMEAWGRLSGLEMTLSRRYRYRGASHSYLSSGCPAPPGFEKAVFPLARTAFSFAGGRKLSGTVVGVCRVRG